YPDFIEIPTKTGILSVFNSETQEIGKTTYDTTILLNSGYKQSVTHRRQHSFSSSKNRYIHTSIEK
ncbi:hypothetical protein, partial [Filifactor villosus]